MSKSVFGGASVGSSSVTVEALWRSYLRAQKTWLCQVLLIPRWFVPEPKPEPEPEPFLVTTMISNVAR
jgi:hypothetical protein